MFLYVNSTLLHLFSLLILHNTLSKTNYPMGKLPLLPKK